MKISLNWIRDYVQLTASVEEISRAITFLGFEVESVHTTGAPKLEHVVVGEILKQTHWLDAPVDVGHWRTHDGQEVDLVIERGDVLGRPGGRVERTHHVDGPGDRDAGDARRTAAVAGDRR